MGNILLISEDENLSGEYLNILGNSHNFKVSLPVVSSLDFIDIEPPDMVLIDECISTTDIMAIVRRIKYAKDNIQIYLITNNTGINTDYLSSLNGIILKNYSPEFINAVINLGLKNKLQMDRLSVRNADMAESLYRLNVLYNTSSQFAGTLETKELLNYMIEGLDKSLSFDLTCTISFGIENEPVLILHSLYDLSEEIVNALKIRTLLNYKSLFVDNNFPFEIDDINLKIIKNIKNPNEKFTFSIFQYDSMFAPIDLGDEFFGCIEIFKEKKFTSDDAAYFQTIVRQVSLPLKSANLYKKIIEKNRELEKLERVKSEFISVVSHELRTPLTPIKNALSILSGGRCGSLSENAIKFVDMAKRNVDNLTSIINDILDINKIEAGKMNFNFRNMDIHSVIEVVKSNFDCVAKEHEINLIANEEQNIPQIYADPQRLGQVLTNLVSNAIKFTPRGKNITIKSEIKNADDIGTSKFFEKELNKLSGNYVIVSVTDEGIGIKEENILKAFDKFTQIENSLTRKVGGTGLGLPIAKQLINAHKGVIWCDSQEGVGSSFYFAIPVSAEIAECKTVQKELL